MKHVFIMIFLFIACFAGACRVNSFDAIDTIVGEAADQSFTGMVAVGEVIQARDSVVGFKGFHAKHNKKESLLTWIKASAAWIVSLFTDYTKGATLFENVFAFGFPESWDREKVVCVAQIDNHYFFKEL